MQRENFKIAQAPVPPLRAEPRHGQPQGGGGHIRGVEASSRGLIRATLGAATAAGAILVLFWLPAEYGIDATGFGGLTGLAEMGEIKQQLYSEALAEDAALAAGPAPATDPQLLARLAGIETQVAAIAAVIGVTARGGPVQGAGVPGAPAGVVPRSGEATVPAAPAAAAVPVAPANPADPAAGAEAAGAEDAAAPAGAAWRDEVSYTLAPAEGIEIKLVMEEGAQARFAWSANGAVLNYDTHGEGDGQKIGYEQGRGEPGQEGALVAAFTGKHGWFWRNRTDAPVTLTLRTSGAYSEMLTP